MLRTRALFRDKAPSLHQRGKRIALLCRGRSWLIQSSTIEPALDAMVACHGQHCALQSARHPAGHLRLLCREVTCLTRKAPDRQRLRVVKHAASAELSQSASQQLVKVVLAACFHPDPTTLPCESLQLLQLRESDERAVVNELLARRCRSSAHETTRPQMTPAPNSVGDSQAHQERSLTPAVIKVVHDQLATTMPQLPQSLRLVINSQR